MNDVPTLIVSDFDEERTLVDPRFARPADARASREPIVPPEPAPNRTTPMPARALHAARKIPTGRVFEGLILFGVLLGLCLVARQQRETANTLRQAMRAMVAANGAPLSQRPTKQAPAAPLPGVEPVSNQPQPLRSAVEREAMEQEAVSAVASNDFELALAKYQALARQFPGFPPYRDAAAVLGTQLGCGRWPQTEQGRCP